MLFRDVGDHSVLLGQASFEFGDPLVLASKLALARRLGPLATLGLLEHARQIVEDLLLPGIEDAGLDAVLVAEIGHGDLVDEVSADNGGLLLGAEVAALAG